MDLKMNGLVLAMAGNIEGIEPSLVVVRGRRDSAGAGIVWRRDGLILTNNHVVNGQAPIVQLSDGRQLPAEILARDPEIDLALLKVEAVGLEAARPALSAHARTGELVFAIGHPWGQRNFVTAGVVSALGELETSSGRRVAFLRTDARLAPGNSGGPLVNASGEVIGINTLIFGGDQGLAIQAQVAGQFASQVLGEPGAREGFI
jgi:serine protease Do